MGKAIDKRPGVSRHAEFAADLRAAMAAKGYTNTFDVAEAVIGRRTGAVANWQKYQFPEAKWWPALRDLLDMDDAKWGPVIAEAERAVLAAKRVTDRRGDGTVVGLGHTGNADITAPATDAARTWAGWGTALKPAWEPIVAARKPLAGTVAANVLAHGTGALNIDATRVAADDSDDTNRVRKTGTTRADGWGWREPTAVGTPPAGRWPANVVLSHADDCGDTVCAGGCPVATLDAQSGESVSPTTTQRNQAERPEQVAKGAERARNGLMIGHADSGGASRFFYTAKASTAERVRLPQAGAGEGRVTGLGGKVRKCNVCGSQAINSGAVELTCGHNDHQWVDNPRAENVAHPTVKPLSLMQWLVRLVTPPGGTVLDPFAGSGTTAEAALLEGFRCITIEREPDYLPLIVQRINRRRDPVAATRAAPDGPSLFDLLEGA